MFRPPRVLLLVLFFAICAGVLFVFRQRILTEERVRRVSCLGNLSTIRDAISNYVATTGEYPATLRVLCSGYLDSPQRLVCFADDFPMSTTAVDYSSYLYTRPESTSDPNAILVQEREGIHRKQGDLPSARGILYLQGRIEMASPASNAIP